jgi:hypothetical protein
VLDESRFDTAFGELPHSFETEPVGLRIAVRIEPVARDQLLADAAPAALCEHGDAGAHLGARRVARAGLARFLDAHVADLHAGDAAVIVEECLRRGETREHVDAELFCPGGELRREQAQGNDEVAGVVLLRRHRQADAAGTRQQRELVALGGDADAGRLLAPVGQQRIERAGFEHCP